MVGFASRTDRKELARKHFSLENVVFGCTNPAKKKELKNIEYSRRYCVNKMMDSILGIFQAILQRKSLCKKYQKYGRIEMTVTLDWIVLFASYFFC